VRINGTEASSAATANATTAPSETLNSAPTATLPRNHAMP
jgi:hypothetical protein